MHYRTVTVVIFLLILASACGFETGNTDPGSVPLETPLPSGAKVLRLDITEMHESGELQSVEIEVGTTIIWTNRDKILHNVTHFPQGRGVEAAFKSGNFALEEVFQHTFNEVREYVYYCSVHAIDTEAIITVVEKS